MTGDWQLFSNVAITLRRDESPTDRSTEANRPIERSNLPLIRSPSPDTPKSPSRSVVMRARQTVRSKRIVESNEATSQRFVPLALTRQRRRTQPVHLANGLPTNNCQRFLSSFCQLPTANGFPK